MTNFTREEINLIHKLWIHTCFGKGHMLIDNLVKGYPSHLKGQMKDDVNNLLRKNILVKKPTRHGCAVYSKCRIQINARKGVKETLQPLLKNLIWISSKYGVFYRNYVFKIFKIHCFIGVIKRLTAYTQH
jgi:hypothetical protein